MGQGAALLQALLRAATTRGRPRPNTEGALGSVLPSFSPPHPPPQPFPQQSPRPVRATRILSAPHTEAGPRHSVFTSHIVGFLVGRLQLPCV